MVPMVIASFLLVSSHSDAYFLRVEGLSEPTATITPCMITPLCFNMPQTGHIGGSPAYIYSHDNISHVSSH